MPKTVGQLKLAVSGFLQRSEETFLRGEAPNQFDLLLNACNNARLYLERAVDLELSHNQISVECSSTNGGDLTTCVLYGTTTPVRIKKLKVVYYPATDVPIELWTKRRWAERVQRLYGDTADDQLLRQLQTNSLPILDVRPVAVQSGQTIFLAPVSTPPLADTFTLSADALTWLPDYVDSYQTDFVLDYCFDWLMYRAIYELNHYLKEDERVQVSTVLVSDAWNAVVKWNDQLILSTVDDVTLD